MHKNVVCPKLLLKLWSLVQVNKKHLTIISISLFIVFIPITYLLLSGWIFPKRFEADRNDKWISKSWLSYYLTKPDSKIIYHRKRVNWSKWKLEGEYTIYNGDHKFIQGYIKNGVWDGKIISWHTNGNISNISFYKNGLQYDKTVNFDEKGNKIHEAKYLDGKKNGEEIYWDSGGVIVAKYIWREDGLDKVILYKDNEITKTFIGEDAKQYFKTIAAGNENKKT